MTVCVATLFRWNYAPTGDPVPQFKIAGLLATDRMITAGDVKYEPQQQKIAQITPRVLVAVAGDLSIHSQAILDTRKTIEGSPDQSPGNVAKVYGRSIQHIKQSRAEDLYLSPLGMNSDTFIAQQKDMSDSFVDRITSQLQSYQGDDVEALVMGADSNNQDVFLYTVDTQGIAHFMNDVGFAAIGIGAWHAKSQLMQVGYVNSVSFAPALAATFAAKKRADIAPGVGEYTDVNLILRDTYFPLWPDIATAANKIYVDYEAERQKLVAAAVERLQVATNEFSSQSSGSRSGDSSSHGHPPTPAAETARPDETRTEEPGYDS